MPFFSWFHSRLEDPLIIVQKSKFCIAAGVWWFIVPFCHVIWYNFPQFFQSFISQFWWTGLEINRRPLDGETPRLAPSHRPEICDIKHSSVEKACIFFKIINSTKAASFFTFDCDWSTSESVLTTMIITFKIFESKSKIAQYSICNRSIRKRSFYLASMSLYTSWSKTYLFESHQIYRPFKLQQIFYLLQLWRFSLGWAAKFSIF